MDSMPTFLHRKGGRIRVAGRRYAMRIWLDRFQMAVHNVTVNEIEERLREQDVELPGGWVENPATSCCSP